MSTYGAGRMGFSVDITRFGKGLFPILTSPGLQEARESERTTITF
jgi:hypothetical protein